MKHIPPNQVAADTATRAPTRRTLAKQQTRQKVLAAARRLFSEEGYEGATIRDIAAAAGMSTGAVFANFSDKSDLFREIMNDDLVALHEAMDAATQNARDVDTALLNLFMAGYTFYTSRLQLARAAFSVSWDMSGGPTLRSLGPAEDLNRLVEGQLKTAVERGELRGDDLEILARLIFDAYLSNFPRAIFGGAGLDELRALAAAQIRILLAGARAA